MSTTYTLSDFDFELPEELIAQKPVDDRDHSRLMVLDREKQAIAHRSFFEITDYLTEGDVLVINNSKVFPARLCGRKPTGGKVELLMLRPYHASAGEGEMWLALLKGKGVQLNTRIDVSAGVSCRVVEVSTRDRTYVVEFSIGGQELHTFFDRTGETPIPPYIGDTPLDESALRDRYQTVFAEHRGSAAAPTAGLHFTSELLKQVEDMGVQIAPVTLHVGYGTFAPVKSDDLSEHIMHSEWTEVPEQTARLVNQAKRTGRRVIAVGTTSVRTLEAGMQDGQLQPGQRSTDMFITPGYTFQAIDGMITNFHTPRSTLLMLVAAFAGYDFMMDAYREAVDKRYRFYSFGDAMVIV